MPKYLIKGATIINEGQSRQTDVLISGERIERIDPDISSADAKVIDAEGLLLLPGCIDDQVHFREPGLTHKADIFTESRAAVAGGITSFMEMPNTVPNTLTQELLEEKYQIASRSSLANYSFFMGTSNSNYEEIMKTDGSKVCGLKIFMGSSTGNMLVDDQQTLERIFANFPYLIATHCEDEATVQANLQHYRSLYGEQLTADMHPLIRDEEACYRSSSFAVDLARKHGTRLHILHISTAKELQLFDALTPLSQKKITAEACIHHLWFTSDDYPEKGNWIKWNPAVKSPADREAIRQAVIDNRIDVIATDHAPHTSEEKMQPYLQAPSGGPLVQHALLAMLDLVEQGVFSIEKVVEKMAHAPAELFRIVDRGYIREGYFADLVLVDPRKKQKVEKANLLYKCGWSPFEGHTFNASVEKTFISGHLAYDQGGFFEKPGQRLRFAP